jgi:hypothetical protein
MRPGEKSEKFDCSNIPVIGACQRCWECGILPCPEAKRRLDEHNRSKTLGYPNEGPTQK